MERIENPEKYQSKDPLRKRIQKFLLKYIIWIPIVCLLSGLLVMLLIYKHQTQNKLLLGVNYDETVKRKDYQIKNSESKLQQFKDKIFEKNQVKRRGRYNRIISGRDVVSVDFGQITYAAGEKIPSEETEKKDTLQQQLKPDKPARRPRKRKRRNIKPPEPKIAIKDTAKQDTVMKVEKPQNPFASLRLATTEQQYTLSYIYGDQELEPGSFIKLRLGEPIEIQGNIIPKGTVFTGKISMSANTVRISVNRIERYPVSYEVYDSDYSRGIVINRPKSPDVENAISNSAYHSAGRSIVDLPYEVLQDVTRSIIEQKRKRQRIIKLNDGYPVYLAKG